VYSIQEGNAALPRKLTAAAKLQAVHLGTAIQAVQRDTPTEQYNLKAVQHTGSTQLKSAEAETADQQGLESKQQMQQQKVEQHADNDSVEFGPYDGVVLATPLEGSTIDLQGVLPPGTVLPAREYQNTVTTYVTGAVDPAYFKVRHC
jgi:hypothetical protein